jgi:hypothetical protein
VHKNDGNWMDRIASCCGCQSAVIERSNEMSWKVQTKKQLTDYRGGDCWRKSGSYSNCRSVGVEEMNEMS